MKYAFIVMGPPLSDCNRAYLHNGRTQIISVLDISEACSVASELQSDGIGCIELCGAFGEEGARRIISITKGQIPVGFVTHFPEQDELFKMAFSKSPS